MVNIKFLGGCRTIGGSAVSITHKDKNIILDYGMTMGRPPKFPVSVSPKDISFIVLSHCHADHSCGLPLLYSGAALPTLITTPPTVDLTRLIVLDTIKISKYFLPYERYELIEMLKNTVTINYNKIRVKNGVSLTLYNAGHVPGSSIILLEVGGKRILYTGDLNLTDTRLVNKAEIDFPSLDYVVIESTYALQEHPSREETERNFIKEVNQIIDNDGIVLVPAFGVSRSQEILLVLTEYKSKFPIYIDGMARNASFIINDHPNYVKDFKLYKHALKKGNFISYNRKKAKQRLQAMSKPGVIIAPSGMLHGGTALMYLESLASNENNAVFLVSFQVPESPGRFLLDHGYLESKNDHQKIDVETKIKLFNFSSHSDKNQLYQFLGKLKLKPGAKIFCMHGEEDACVEFAKNVNKKFNIEAFAPKNDEIF
ncbi:MAG: MBL fold metallo-hydrolase [Candidatus Helarchaeota archaeon]